MNDFQFYPTPKWLAKKAWAKFKDRNFLRPLDSSAGDGVLGDALPRSNYADAARSLTASSWTPANTRSLPLGGVPMREGTSNRCRNALPLCHPG